jgi:hypothetical protein
MILQATILVYILHKNLPQLKAAYSLKICYLTKICRPYTSVSPYQILIAIMLVYLIVGHQKTTPWVASSARNFISSVMKIHHFVQTELGDSYIHEHLQMMVT